MKESRAKKMPSFSSKKASSLLDDSKEKVGNIYKVVKNQASDFYEGSKEQLDHVQANLNNYSEQVANWAKEKPLVTSLLAGSVAFLVSLLLLKRK